MDITPRNSFNCRLAGRYWQIPTAIPRATQLNTPIGTHYCDTLGFICHPQKYDIFRGNYPNTDHESSLLNLDYYNPLEANCQSEKDQQRLHPHLIQEQFSGVSYGNCPPTPKLWNNTSKLDKYDKYPKYPRHWTK